MFTSDFSLVSMENGNNGWGEGGQRGCRVEEFNLLV